MDTIGENALKELIHRRDEIAVRAPRAVDVAVVAGVSTATVSRTFNAPDRVASHHGIDLSEAALELASQALETLACPVTLDRRDFVEALRDRPEPVDVAWIGLSLRLAVWRQSRDNSRHAHRSGRGIPAHGL